MREVFDCDHVRRLVELFDEQLRGIDLILGLLCGPFHDCFSYRSVIVIVAIIEQMFVIAEENIANDCVDNVSQNGEFN
jgi:hypothetical protein